MIEPPNNTPIEGILPGAWREWFTRVGILANGDSGTTANRPTRGLYIGKSYFDTDLGYPVYLVSVKPNVWTDGAPPSGAVIAPTLVNSWVNSGGSSVVAGYWKDAGGVVHLRGRVTGGALGTDIFTLPVGFRPWAKEEFPVVATGAFGAIAVLDSGQVQFIVGDPSTVWIPGITFRV